MADRRMIHRKVVESDSFYGLPPTAQALYLHLTIAGDEDGFVNCASSIASRFKTGKTDLQTLVKKRFLLKFDEVYVIKHWRIGNSLKNDRKKPPAYPGLAAKIWVKSNRAYTDHPVEGCVTLLETKTGIRPESQMESKTESEWNPDGIQNGFPIRTEPNKNRIRTEPNRTPGGDFQKLLMEYPEARRGSEAQAEELFRVEITSEEAFGQAMENLTDWKRSEQWTKEGGRFIPYLANWLERGVWKTRPPDAGYKERRDLSEEELEAIRQTMAEDMEGW